MALQVQDKYAAVVRIRRSREDHELVAYLGQFAAAIGWVRRDQTKRRPAAASDSQLGMAESRDTQFWVEAGTLIHDRPRGSTIGVFTRDTEVLGRRQVGALRKVVWVSS